MERDGLLDILRGVGIFLVVLGHTTYFEYDIVLWFLPCLFVALIVPVIMGINRYIPAVVGRTKQS